MVILSKSIRIDEFITPFFADRLIFANVQSIIVCNYESQTINPIMVYPEILGRYVMTILTSHSVVASCFYSNSLYALYFVVNKEYEGGINGFDRSKLLIKER